MFFCLFVRENPPSPWGKSDHSLSPPSSTYHYRIYLNKDDIIFIARFNLSAHMMVHGFNLDKWRIYYSVSNKR